MALPILWKQKYDYLEELMPNDELYRHTRYRFLSNDVENLALRYLKFNLQELINVAIKAVGNGASSCTKLLKCLEGQYNKAFILTLNNGTEVLAKLPNPNAGPKFFTTASEVATREFIRKVLRLPVPKIYAYSSDPDNPVGVEYILEEKASSIPLARVWYSWSKESKMALVTQLVDYEAQLMSVRFKKHGCIYYKKDLEEKGIIPEALEAVVPISNGAGKALSFTNEYAFGPLNRMILWQKERGQMNLDRGPWSRSFDYMAAMGRNEIIWAKLHAKPQISPYHSIKDLESPEHYISLLHRYMALIPRIMPPPIWTSLHHPDLNLGNIFIDPDTRQITSIIDWQSASVCEPYFQSDTPRMLIVTGQNFLELTSHERTQRSGSDQPTDTEFEFLRHYRYLSKLKDSQRWAALEIPFREVIVAPTSLVSGAWQNHDVYSLFDSLITIASVWPDMAPRPGQPCPLSFSEGEIANYKYETEIVQGLSLVLHQLHNDNLVPLGGVVYQERYEHAAAINREFRDMFIDMAETEDKKAIASRAWPYQDRR